MTRDPSDYSWLPADLRAFIAMTDADYPPDAVTLSMARQRAVYDTSCARFDQPHPPGLRTEDRTIAGVPCRRYIPTAPRADVTGVYFHGGGFVVGGLDSHDASCRHLARHATATVIAVDYRMAPEDPFPAAVDDACATFRWVHANVGALAIDPARIAVAGDSAGGNLAAVVAQQMRSEGHPPPCWQLLIYPATDMTRSCESHALFADGFFLNGSTVDWFLANYLSDPTQALDPRASPLATRDVSGLPPAHVVVAGFDPLRDEGEAYAHALMAAGVPTTLRCYGSQVHGFFGMGGLIRSAAWAVEDIAGEARRALWP